MLSLRMANVAPIMATFCVTLIARCIAAPAVLNTAGVVTLPITVVKAVFRVVLAPLRSEVRITLTIHVSAATRTENMSL